MKLEGNIVIIDEAHNLIETINNIHSNEVSSAQVWSSFILAFLLFYCVPSNYVSISVWVFGAWCCMVCGIAHGMSECVFMSELGGECYACAQDVPTSIIYHTFGQLSWGVIRGDTFVYILSFIYLWIERNVWKWKIWFICYSFSHNHNIIWRWRLCNFFIIDSKKKP